ncbi:MAG: carbamoyl-phosphate synthase large subunit [Eubacteriales bacterium]|nr:carbamoyl-phosphate synthase large subunit [Eubacteriales bacterium]
MPKRNDIHTILIIGSGPIIIGQACEFDYSGTQACKALRRLGYKIVLVNSNPATIMTDTDLADVTYIEPLNVNRLTEIIEKERPDALLPNLGGQSGLNLSIELAKAGVLEKFGVEVIGVQLDAIERGEDRIEFKRSMEKLGIDMARSYPAYNLEEAEKIAQELGYPVVLRPAYTMGGTGGGIVYNHDELKSSISRALQSSLINQVLVEEAVIGWEELELEVVRDSKNQMVTVCYIENIDPMGIHTGDSFCSAPMLTVSKELQERLQSYAYSIVEEIKVIGGTNVQFAHDPVTDRVIVIEINPRTSRSSALASKATGFPIAMISAMLAVGLNLDEIPYYRDGTLDKYTPCGDYVVIKFARWAFDKFSQAEDKLGSQMKAVGEIMSIGKTYKEALQKAIRSLESGRFGLGHAKNYRELSKQELLRLLVTPTSERQFIMYEALRKGATVEQLCELTHIKSWFIEQMHELVLEENALTDSELTNEALARAKRNGFSDKYIANLRGTSEEEIRERRISLGIEERYDEIPVSGVAEHASYYYSTYNTDLLSDSSHSGRDFDVCDKCDKNDNKKVMILGSGPNRIGQGIEFDYCCVHAAFALHSMGYKSIMVNCNPETVSTDYDTADILYFEPLTTEEVLNIYKREKPLGIIAQFGGQTPLNLSRELEKYGCKILGTSPDSIDLAEDRDRFKHMMDVIGVPMPESGMASTVEEAIVLASEIGYPLILRPSYVLGGRGMEIVRDESSLVRYVKNAIGVTPDRPILIDRFLINAIETEADAIADNGKAFVPAVMEHIELAGIHSGDSACVIPSLNVPEKHVATINRYTELIANKLNVCGLMNMQYAIADDKVYVLEANPRASRTVPLVSKICNMQMAKIATRVIMHEFTGGPSPLDELQHKKIGYYGVKEAVFPFNMFPEVDPILGPEMRSTGEVLGINDSFGIAFYKSQEAAQLMIPQTGNVLISVNDEDKAAALETARIFKRLGLGIIATDGTYNYLKKGGVDCVRIKKLYEGRPNIVDEIMNNNISFVINTPAPRSVQAQSDDSYIRKTAIRKKISYMTTMAAANAAAVALDEMMNKPKTSIKSLQEFHASIV